MFKSVRSSLATRCWLGALMMIVSIGPGCTLVPTKTAAPVPATDTIDHSSLVAGRRIYVSLLKCGMCHRPKPVSDYSAQAWAEDILPRMSKKAKLSPQQYSDVLAYVTSLASRE
ncbi:MAG: hypothetical protein ACK5OB_11555 [Pirellula sp.]